MHRNQLKPHLWPEQDEHHSKAQGGQKVLAIDPKVDSQEYGQQCDQHGLHC
jgi:hypothetical protein